MRVFNETQRFTQWWLHLINSVILVFLAYVCYNWYVLKKAVGNVSLENNIGQITVITITLLSIALIYLFRLKTSMDEIGIHYQFIPLNLSKKTIRWNELEKCQVRTYKPFVEYGGWGYRNPLGKNRAINVKGNKGIQLELKNNRKLLIGTQKDEDAKKVIQRYFNTKDE